MSSRGAIVWKVNGGGRMQAVGVRPPAPPAWRRKCENCRFAWNRPAPGECDDLDLDTRHDDTDIYCVHKDMLVYSDYAEECKQFEDANP